MLAAFFQILLQEGGGNIVYTTLINASTTGFNGAPWDFEMLDGEKGGDAAVTPYYFWVELS